MIELFASESAASTFSLSTILELGVIISTIVLTLATAGLWYATAQVHKDEVVKMSGDLSHANDNMTDVAMAEIEAHHPRRHEQRVRELKRIQARKHR